MRLLRLILFLSVMLIGAAFAVMNADPVSLDFYFGIRELPLSVVLVGAVCLGALLGMLASLGGFFRLKRENAELRRREKLVSEEVNNLRSLPIKGR
ncbi:MAG: LapA family protein [Gammaproteobacteria bacterium]|nr:LapA family protein [Gammaproteobacteria bacterium]